IVSRILLGQSSTFTEELARFSLIWITVLGITYLTAKDEHLAIDFFVSKLPDRLRHRRSRVIHGIVGLFALIVLIIGGSNLVYITYRLGQTSPALQLPLYFVYIIVPISGLMTLYFSISHIFSKIDS
ncbi:MAG: TRAP transporter small permease, partial [Bacteroidota bacterium]